MAGWTLEAHEAGQAKRKARFIELVKATGKLPEPARSDVLFSHDVYVCLGVIHSAYSRRTPEDPEAMLSVEFEGATARWARAIRAAGGAA